jgi:hypothetical protein
MTNNITKMIEHYIKMIDKNYKMTEQYIYIYIYIYILWLLYSKHMLRRSRG